MPPSEGRSITKAFSTPQHSPRWLTRARRDTTCSSPDAARRPRASVRKRERFPRFRTTHLGRSTVRLSPLQ